MAYKPSDEILVEQLSDIATVYHLEVYQRDQDNEGSFPCIVYWRSGFDPYRELSGEAGIAKYSFTVLALASDSSDLRRIADAIQMTYEYDYLLAVQQKFPDSYVDDWTVADEEEFLEVAMELQSKGIKVSSLRISLLMVTKQQTRSDQCP